MPSVSRSSRDERKGTHPHPDPGGGFGGVYTALSLERTLKRELRRGEVEIALVSLDNYLTFQPMLTESFAWPSTGRSISCCPGHRPAPHGSRRVDPARALRGRAG